jgi:3'(2'), 5'-bisphosphate nucleotidase
MALVTTPYARELEVARELALRAGTLILGYRGVGVDVFLKPGDEPVTRADREASELIVAGLSHAFPADVIVSEEAADDPRRLAPGARVWFVDPLDGTKDFIRGLSGFAVMIGLCVDGRPCLGVIYQPVGARLFVAADGAGARLFTDEDESERVLAVSTVGTPERIRLVASASHRTDDIDRVKSALGVDDELNVGSVGLKLGLIALGERDLYVNPSSKCKMWDTCAPEALLTQAGGRLSDIHGRPLRYDRADLWHSAGLLASNSLVHDAVVEKLRPLFPLANP